MEIKEALLTLDRVLELAKHGVIAYIGADGAPVIRWMTPTIIRGREGFLYALTSPKFAKAAAISKSPRVSWMIQSPGMAELVSLQGEIALHDNPSLKSLVIEAVGGNLGTFWRINKDETSLVVLETKIISIEYTKPAVDTHQVVQLA